MSNLLSQASLVMIPSGYKEDVVYSQIPTNGNGDLSFTRASNGTRVNSAGLVEVCPWNLQTYSEDFTNGKYTLAAASITSNTTNAPNGTATADKLVENTANDQHYIFFTSQQTAYNETRISVYAKAGGRTKLLMWESAITNAQSLFDLSTGVVTSSSSGNAANLSTTVGQIEDAGNGWYRCSFNYSTSSGGGTIRLQLYTTTTSYTGDGTSSIFIWGLQENIGSTAKPYFPTTDRLNVPRLTYQNGGGGCPSLLLEKQSTNHILYSEDYSQTAWTKNGVALTTNATTSPDGTTNADLLTTNDAAGSVYRMYEANSAGSDAVCTTSVYFKYGNWQYVFIIGDNYSGSARYAVFDLINITNTFVSSGYTATITSVGNGWYKCTFTGEMKSDTYNQFGLAPDNSSHSGTSLPNGKTLYIWGTQREQSSYPTSYIPTTSSSATRVADACFKTGISSLIGQTEGTMFADFVFTNNNTVQVIMCLHDNADNKRVEIWANASSLYGFVGGSSSFNIASITATSGTRYKVAVAYKSGDSAFYVNGTQIGTDSTTFTISLTSLIFNYWSGAYPPDAKINEAIIFPTRLTNAELASLTTI